MVVHMLRTGSSRKIKYQTTLRSGVEKGCLHYGVSPGWTTLALSQFLILLPPVRRRLACSSPF